MPSLFQQIGKSFRGLSRTIEQTVQPPYLVIDGRRMIPDSTALINKGYDYLAVGSPLAQNIIQPEHSPNGYSQKEIASQPV